MDPLLEAVIAFRQQRYELCVERCSALLRQKPDLQSAWSLKCTALSQLCCTELPQLPDDGQQVATGGGGGGGSSLADSLLHETPMAPACRPGTSLRSAPGTAGGVRGRTCSTLYRPVCESGRPLSGVARRSHTPGTVGTSTDMRRTLRTARPSTGSALKRPVTAYIEDDSCESAFIVVSRLNLVTIAKQPALAKPLFLYLLHCENDVKSASELALEGGRACGNQDWWWLAASGRCYSRLGMLREAEANFNTAFKLQPTVVTCLLLAQLYIRMDQPVAALETYRRGLRHFGGQVCLLNSVARIYEALGDSVRSVRHYREAVRCDATSVEAVACLALTHFYSDQPELALTLYRRLLQMGVYSGELFNNVALCCFYGGGGGGGGQQLDTVWTCFQRALALATDDAVCSDIWYNMGHVAVGLADIRLAYQCFSLAVSTVSCGGEAAGADTPHYSGQAGTGGAAAAHNNLGVLEQRAGNWQSACSHYEKALALAPHLFEPAYNWASICHSRGDLQQSYALVQQALSLYPDHADSQQLLTQLLTQLQLTFASVI